MELFLELTGFCLLLVAVVGSVLPLLPGAPLALAGAVLIGWARDFSLIGWPTLITLAVLTVLSLITDVVSTALGAKRSGASRFALAGAAAGTLLGLFFGIIGAMVGPFVGALIAELTVSQDLKKAWNVGLGSWLGLLIGSVIKAGISLAMLVTVIFAYIF